MMLCHTHLFCHEKKEVVMKNKLSHETCAKQLAKLMTHETEKNSVSSSSVLRNCVPSFSSVATLSPDRFGVGPHLSQMKKSFPDHGLNANDDGDDDFY